jgi:cob(I)alamin adenosyltransferase
MSVKIKARIDETSLKIGVHNDHVKKIFNNQYRLRENIKSLENVQNSVLVERYLKDLNQEEDDLRKANKEVELLEAEREKKKEDLKVLKLSVNLESSKLLSQLN